MLRALALLSIGLGVVTVVASEGYPISFRKAQVTVERPSEEVLILERVSLRPAFPDETTISPAAEGGIHANRKDHLYYLPSCDGYKQVSAEDMVPFLSEEIATEAGYQRAESCS